MSENSERKVTLSLVRDFEFVASFPDLPDGHPILLDEPPPLGEGRGPNAAALLAAAVGNCLAASLAFCLRRARVELDGLRADVTAQIVRNDAGRFRVQSIDVELAPSLRESDRSRLTRCEGLFEDFCIVTESVRQGIPVKVSVKEPASAQEAEGANHESGRVSRDRSHSG